mgnify:CR=1 FL=1
MPHQHARHALSHLKKLGSFWPVVGVLGLRQCGKTTLLCQQFKIPHQVSLDDEEVREDALASAKNLLSKLETPVVIDEVQKAPNLFDAIKLRVDRDKRPGTYFLTGSTSFSARLGIRESLTGRIGLMRLFPFTMAEAHEKEWQPRRAALLHSEKARFSTEEVIKSLAGGGLPVPAFIRDSKQRSSYFQNWLETAMIRDVSRVFGKNYDPDVAWSLLRQMAVLMRNGDLPVLRAFRQGSRKVRRYLAAMEDVFLLTKVPIHEEGVGDDAWVLSDSGLAKYLMGSEFGEGATLSLARAFLLKEIQAQHEYAGTPLRPVYYKSTHGSPVDLIHERTAIKITTATGATLSYEERALAGAMKTLRLKHGILAAPTDRPGPLSKSISVVPWGHWS